MKKENYTNKLFSLLKELKHLYPSWEISKHIAGATTSYKDVWGISDKQFCFELEKYMSELSLENNDEDLSLILTDAEHLDTLLMDDIEEEY